MIFTLITSLPMIVCLFWTAILWMDWRREQSVVKLRLMVFSSVVCLLYVGHYVYFNKVYEVLPVSDVIYSMSNLLVYPLFFLYVKQLTDAEWSKRKWCAWAVLPALLVGMTMGGLFLMMSPEERNDFVENQFYTTDYIGHTPIMRAQYLLHEGAKVLFAIQVVSVLLASYRKLKKFDEMAENYYADTEERNTQTIRSTIMVMLFACVLSVVVNVLGRSFFTHSQVALGVVSVGFTLLLFMLLYAGHNQNFSVEDMVKDDLAPALEEEECMECEGECMRSEEESVESEGERMRSEEESVECEGECMRSEEDCMESEEEEKVKVKTGVKTPEAVNVWAKRNVPIREQIEKLRTEIERVMEEEKLYLIHDFRLTDLIERMKTNREYVYRAVNVGMGMSFSQMVNRKRIEYALELLKKQPDIDISELYSAAGFTSQAVFYRNFKSYTGKSPKAFVQDIDVNLL